VTGLERIARAGRGIRFGHAWPLWLLLASGFFPAPFPAEAGERARVLEVFDGDTLLVRAGQDVSTVRLIGIDSPEMGHPARPREFLSVESAAYLSALCEGKEVLLEPDEEDTDTYGRYLRYVFLPAPDGIWKDVGRAELSWLRASGAEPVLVYPASGRTFAVVYGDRGNPDVEREELGRTISRIVRLRAENAGSEYARKAEEAGFRPLTESGSLSAPPFPPSGRGEDREPAGNARPAGETVPWERARSYIGRDVTVEGKIVRTHRGKNILFLNFHPNWKKYLSVVIYGKDLPGFPDNPETFYRNKTLRVRGTVTLHKDRPEIVVTSPAAITDVGGTGN